MKRMNFGAGLAVVVVLNLLSAVKAEERKDILIADFEQKDYGAWKVEGDAFGHGPARGTLPHQMKVEGFEGKGLVNSFNGGDRATGSLTSPPFKIERTYLRFLIGGGGYAGETCINLLIHGKVVRTATGPNTSPGGSENLEWHSWEVGELEGKEAILQIVDRRTGGWGHINVDQILQTDKKLPALTNAQRQFTLEKRYLNIPISNNSRKRIVRLVVDGKDVRQSEIELADEKADWWAVMDVAAFAGKQATLIAEKTPDNSQGLALVEQSDSIKDSADLYNEKLRPQFHFSQKRGWNNDPNGMVFYDGEYHLFFQHNPYGWKWNNMHWGQAISRDLVHWNELPTALYPWTMAKAHCFSGSAAVDWNNTGGFGTGKEKPLIAMFTDTGCGEALAYSNDRGRTWTYYEGNPVIQHKGRDPKLLWYAPGKHWVVALYDEFEGKRQVAFYTSADLKKWELASRIEGFYECPEIQEMAVDGNKDDTRWVLFAADAQYVIGKFDGRTFTPEHPGKHRVHWGKYYASQVFNDAPGGRKIQIGWAQIAMEGMAFNQMVSFPAELSLRRTPEGLRMMARPVKEIELLRSNSQRIDNKPLAAGQALELPLVAELYDLRVEIEPGASKLVTLLIGDQKLIYTVAGQGLTVLQIPAADSKSSKPQGVALTPIPLAMQGGKIRLQFLIDRPSLEICGNDGEVMITSPLRSEGGRKMLTIASEGGDGKLILAEIHELKSAWK